MKAILEFLMKNNRWAVVLVLLLIILGGGMFKIRQNKINEWKNKHQIEIKLRNALIDTVSYYKNAHGEEVAEKLTLQGDVKDLEKMNNDLTDSQKELLRRVKEANKKNTVIAAALVEANLIIDSLITNGNVVINSKDTTITFTDTTKYMEYKFVVGKAIPVDSKIEPTLLFSYLKFSNKQTVKFEWENNKKEGYPVKFIMSNSNPYYKVNEINSYIIPKADKAELNPTSWKKVSQWFDENGKILGFIGSVVGAGGTYLLMK